MPQRNIRTSGHRQTFGQINRLLLETSLIMTLYSVFSCSIFPQICINVSKREGWEKKRNQRWLWWLINTFHEKKKEKHPEHQSIKNLNPNSSITRSWHAYIWNWTRKNHYGQKIWKKKKLKLIVVFLFFWKKKNMKQFQFLQVTFLLFPLRNQLPPLFASSQTYIINIVSSPSDTTQRLPFPTTLWFLDLRKTQLHCTAGSVGDLLISDSGIYWISVITAGMDDFCTEGGRLPRSGVYVQFKCNANGTVFDPDTITYVCHSKSNDEGGNISALDFFSSSKKKSMKIQLFFSSILQSNVLSILNNNLKKKKKNVPSKMP